MMRMLGLMLVGSLGLGGCAKPPILAASHLPQVASGVVAAFNDVDGREARLTALFAKPAQARSEGDRMKWMHEQVGDCGEMQPLWSRGHARAGFAFTCERGGLEVQLRLDGKGRIAGISTGVAGVQPSAPVASAFQTVLASMPWREAGAGRHAWGDGLMHRWIRQRGRCELERVRLVREHVGLFELRCERGRMSLKVGVDKHGAINAVRAWRPEQDPARAYRNKPMG